LILIKLGVEYGAAEALLLLDYDPFKGLGLIPCDERKICSSQFGDLSRENNGSFLKMHQKQYKCTSFIFLPGKRISPT
jgi:hypothetical protein